MLFLYVVFKFMFYFWLSPKGRGSCTRRTSSTGGGGAAGVLGGPPPRAKQTAGASGLLANAVFSRTEPPSTKPTAGVNYPSWITRMTFGAMDIERSLSARRASVACSGAALCVRKRTLHAPLVRCL